MSSAACPECHCQIRTTIPKGGDGSIDVFVRHSTKGAVRRMCPGSRREVQYPPSALEKIQSYDGSGQLGRVVTLSDEQLRTIWRKAGGSFHGPIVEHGSIEEAKLLPFLRRLVSFTPLTPAEVDLACEAYAGPGVHGEAIRAAVEAVLAKRAAP